LADGPGVSKLYLCLQEAYFRMTWIRPLFDQRDPRQFVGEGHDDDIAVGAAQRRFGLPAERRVPLGDIRRRRSRAVDQQLVIFIAPLANDLPRMTN
jgi:hypothetical protein